MCITYPTYLASKRLGVAVRQVMHRCWPARELDVPRHVILSVSRCSIVTELARLYVRDRDLLLVVPPRQYYEYRAVGLHAQYIAGVQSLL